MKKIFFSAAVIALAAISAVKASDNDNKVSNLTMNDVEMLAEGEPCSYTVNGKLNQACMGNTSDPCTIYFVTGGNTNGYPCTGYHF